MVLGVTRPAQEYVPLGNLECPGMLFCGLSGDEGPSQSSFIICGYIFIVFSVFMNLCFCCYCRMFHQVLLSFVVASILFTVVGYMISRKDKHRRRAVSALESARIYEHGHNNKDSVADTRQSSDRSRSVNYRSLGGNRRSRSPSPIGTAAHLVANGYSRNGFGGGSGRANRSPSTSMCEMVRRTFSGVGLTPSDDGYDSNYSDDTARLIEGADRLPHRVRFSGEGTGGAATGGERETLLMDGWRSGMRRKGTL